MIKLVVFDWNGTILADTICCFEGDNAVFKSLGRKPITLSQFRNAFDVPIINFYKKIGIDTKLANASYQKNEALFHSVYEKRAAKVRTRAHVRYLLIWLKKKKVDSVILSNHTYVGIDKHLKRLVIENYFSDVIANNTIGLIFKGRSKGEKIKNYLNKKEIKPKEVVIVGDTSEEIEISRNLGAKSIAITNGYFSTPRLRTAKPNFLIHDLKEVIGIIESLNSPNS